MEEVSNVQTLLTEDDKHDACVLAVQNHELMCVEENCSRNHNTKKRPYFGLFQCRTEDIRLLKLELEEHEDSHMDEN